MYIKEGSRYEWEYKKCNSKFLKKGKNKGGNREKRDKLKDNNRKGECGKSVRIHKNIYQNRQEYNT